MSETDLITRREAILRVSALLGGVALVGHEALLAGRRPACAATGTQTVPFAAGDIAFLDEVAETILPETSTPGAKAAKTGAFMALMVTDSYDAADQRIFRQGMRAIDDASRKAHGVPFMQATPKERLALLDVLDREQKAHSDVVDAARRRKSLAWLADERKEAPPAGGAPPAAAISADSPRHYFRMMKELALLGFFTSEIGCTKAQRYVESPGRFDPCVPFRPGEKAWAPHA
jgi:hypothetical protein